MSLPHQTKDPQTGIIKLIPMIYGGGNHDYGVSAGAGVEVPDTKHGPVIKHYFPQNTHDNQIPGIKQRKSYFANRFGKDLLLVSLDTAYQSEMGGEQAKWLEQELQSRDYKIKVANYHDPIYLSFRRDPLMHATIEGMKHWVPLFDKYNLTVASENHSHIFKRTHPMKNNQPSSEGTVYIGEGSWGQVDINPKEYEQKWTHKADIKQIVWIMKIDGSDKLKIEARDGNNKLVDYFELQI